MTDTTEATGAITANHDPLIDYKEVTFNFRKTKDPETGVETKRESITVRLAVPSFEGLAAIMNAGGKELDQLLAAAEGVIVDYAKQLAADNPNYTSENFPVAAVSWATIANLPETERKGRGISKEIWEDFIKSYIEAMPAIIGKPVEVVKKQASILAQKFQPLKNHEKKNELLPKFVEMLALYVNNAAEAEQFTAPIEFLTKKAEELMAADNAADLAENLGF